MGFIEFVQDRWPVLSFLAYQHMGLVVQTLLLPTVLALVIGTLIYRSPLGVAVGNSVTAIGLTIPSYALLGVLVGVVGLGVVPSPRRRRVRGALEAMAIRRRGHGLTMTSVLIVVLTAGCGLQSASGAVREARAGLIGGYDSLKDVTVILAAKDFTEQLILGNMFSTVLAAAGAKVTNLTNIPGSFGARHPMVSGQADISREYTGTGWINYLGNENPSER